MVAGISDNSKDANVLIGCMQSTRKELLVEETGQWFLDKCSTKTEAEAGGTESSMQHPFERPIGSVRMME